MLNKQRLQSCIQNCQTAASDLRSMTMEASTPAKMSLDQASKSIDTCIKQCQDALTKL